jgi:hypothetical protein
MKPKIFSGSNRVVVLATVAGTPTPLPRARDLPCVVVPTFLGESVTTALWTSRTVWHAFLSVASLPDSKFGVGAGQPTEEVYGSRFMRR